MTPTDPRTKALAIAFKFFVDDRNTNGRDRIAEVASEMPLPQLVEIAGVFEDLYGEPYITRLDRLLHGINGWLF